MFARHCDEPFAAGYRRHGHDHGHWHGPRGSWMAWEGWGAPRRGPWGRRRGGGGILPFLAAAFVAKAVLQHRHRHGHRSRGWESWGWREDDPRRHSHHGPWGRGRHKGPHGRGGRDWGEGRAVLRDLLPEVGALAGLLRDTFRRGAIEPRQMDEIRGVVVEARRRIAAILAENRTSGKMV